METKQKLGQFYTTNYKYILSNMTIPDEETTIIEPFAGDGSLLNFIDNQNKYKIELYDIDPKKHNINKQDTLLNPPDYKYKFILTNPPYLARNKNTNKTLYDKYQTNDLYKCFIKSIINCHCNGGIIIVPLNFLCSIRESDIKLRKTFINEFQIKQINIFEEQVFNDTKYSVCSILFIRKNNNEETIDLFIYPSNISQTINLNKLNNYTFGGEIYKLPQNKDIIIERATKNTNYQDKYLTNILLKCIDDNNINKLGLKIVKNNELFIDNTQNLTARSYASIVLNINLEEKVQELLVLNVNEYINTQRKKYNSLFLTNYRESNTIARKRISFDLAFKIINYIISTNNSIIPF